MAQKSISVRIDSELLDQLHVVADYEGRSANSQILVLIRKCVEAYEKEHGPILNSNRDASKN
ncbi:MAG: Arc family DNA-binding protein [Clostridia bacterium]|nr:Arc family DNA-binding protein [Clostridiales bacterium]MBQ2978449.1 Arc family DNA-binding protein [Clostridia bacterium]MBQ6805522.1 Arc family DNA-binding protein [Clostridia bacterium]MDD6683194.1 Arc family DNA-binding protein [Clostridiales bacterium]